MPSPRMPLALALAAAISLTACTAAAPGGETPGGAGTTEAPAGPDAASSPLEAALERIPVGSGGVSIAVSDVHRAEQLGAYDAPGPFSTAGVLGFGSLANIFALLHDLVPDGALENATASTGGVAPDSVVRFDGVANASDALAEVAGERTELAGGTLLVRRADHEIDFNDPDFPPQALAHLNVIWFDDTTVIAGTARANVERWVAPTAPTAASAFPGLAACLGDAIGVSAVTADLARTSGDVGIAIDESAGAAVQTLCVQTDDATSAVDRITGTVEDGVDPVTGRAWAELLGDATVDDAGDGWVRVRSSDATPDIFFALMQQGGLGALVD